MNLAAIKMFTQVIEEHQKDDISAVLPVMVPGLLKVVVRTSLYFKLFLYSVYLYVLFLLCFENHDCCFVFVQGYENSQSSVRKASVVCLVSVYLCVGEALRPFLQDLHGSKVNSLQYHSSMLLLTHSTDY